MKQLLITFLILCTLSSCVFANQTEDKLQNAINLYKSGNYNSCIKEMNEVVNQDSSYPIAYYYIGLSYAKTNKKDLALKNYDKAIKLSNDKSLKSMAQAAKDCLGTTGFTALDAQLVLSNNSKAEKLLPANNEEKKITLKNEVKPAEVQNTKPIVKTEKMPSNAEIGAAIMTLKKAGLWNGNLAPQISQTQGQAQQQTQQNQQKELQKQQNMMAKMYMQQMTQQMNNPAYLMMNMNGNGNNNNNNMMNMLPFLMNNQDGSNKASNQQLIQSMMMSQMMPNLDFSFNSNNDNR